MPADMTIEQRAAVDAAVRRTWKYGGAGIGKKGEVCNCAHPVKVGSATYCTFAGAASQSVVAQCSKP
jgi:hypothetical protein